MTLLSHGFAKSHDKLKTFHHYHRAYGYQTWQGKNLTLRDSYLQRLIGLESRCLARSRGNLKTLYLHHQRAYDRQTRWGWFATMTGFHP